MNPSCAPVLPRDRAVHLGAKENRLRVRSRVEHCGLLPVVQLHGVEPWLMVAVQWWGGHCECWVDSGKAGGVQLRPHPLSEC
jgi:hypothetical protein